MLTNFFGNSKPVNSVVLITLFFVLTLITFFSGKIQLEWGILPLFLVVFGIVNFINAKNNLTFDNSYMFLFFVLLLGFFPETIHVNKAFYVNLTLLLFLRKVYSLQSSKKIFQKLFDGGFWIGISFLIEPFSVIFVLLIYTSIYLHQQLTIRSLIIPVLGFFAPVFLYFTYCFWNDNTDYFYQLFSWFTDYDFNLYKNINYLFSLFFVGVFLLVCIIAKTPKALAVKNSFRKNWMLILLHLSLSVFLVILMKNKTGSELLSVLFPSAIILANGLELFQKKLIGNIVLVVFFISSIVMSII